MSLRVDVKIDKSGIAGLATGPMKRAVVRALRKAGATALRDMRSEATKRMTSAARAASSGICAVPVCDVPLPKERPSRLEVSVLCEARIDD